MWPSPCSAYWISWLTPTGRPPHTCEGGFNSCMIMNENSRWDSKFQLRVRGQFPWTFKLSNPCSYQGDRSVAHPCSSLILCWPLILLDEDAVVTMCLVLGGATLIVAVFFFVSVAAGACGDDRDNDDDDADEVADNNGNDHYWRY